MLTSLQSLLNLFFPVRCIGCQTPGVALCEPCVRTLPTALPSEDERIFAIYNYGNPIVEKAVRDCKYYRKSEAFVILAASAAPHIAEYVAERLQSAAPEKLILVPIPQHKSKTRTRGFNQSTYVADAIARELPDTTVAALLEKTRSTIPQAHVKNKSARLVNVQGTMKTRGDVDKRRFYVLVDDVTTTGATFAEASRALRAAGAQKILCIALAHGYARKK